MVTQIRMQVEGARNGTRSNSRESDTGQIQLRTRAQFSSEASSREQYVQAPPRRGFGRDLFVAVALGIAAIVAYPSIEQYLPYAWRSNITAVMNQFRPVQAVASQGSAVDVSDLNLRQGPSTSTAVVALLPRGSNVATIEKRGDWMLVQLEADNRAQPTRGWVFGSFLKEIEDDEPETSEDAD
jgi:uncharacterized protein YgiM (DUF1202 family)